MKRVKKLIKLTNLSSESLNEKDLQLLTAGTDHYCGCYYEYCGGSGDEANDAANEPGGLESEFPWDEAEWGFDF